MITLPETMSIYKSIKSQSGIRAVEISGGQARLVLAVLPPLTSGAGLEDGPCSVSNICLDSMMVLVALFFPLSGT